MSPIKVNAKNNMKSQPDPPKRPLSSYFLFLQDVREEVNKDHAGTSVGDISKLAGERWRNIDEETKCKFQERAIEVKRLYEIKKIEYEQTYGSIKKARKKKKAEKLIAKKEARM